MEIGPVVDYMLTEPLGGSQRKRKSGAKAKAALRFRARGIWRRYQSATNTQGEAQDNHVWLKMRTLAIGKARERDLNDLNLKTQLLRYLPR